MATESRTDRVRYHCEVRFRLRVDLWMEVESLADAEEAMGRASQAAHAPLGPAAVGDIDTGALARSCLTPIDDAAAAALTAEDLGPGISSALFAIDEPDSEQR
jgi:hypothetical protein